MPKICTADQRGEAAENISDRRQSLIKHRSASHIEDSLVTLRISDPRYPRGLEKLFGDKGPFTFTRKIRDADGNSQVALYEGSKVGFGQVCIKVSMAPKSSESRQTLAKEYRKLASVKNHPYVVKAIDFVECDAFGAIIMEKMDMDIFELTELSTEQGVGRPSVEAARLVCRQLLNVVKTLHEKYHTAHMDIKPENILMRFPPGTHPSGRKWEAKDYFDAEHTLKFQAKLADLAFSIPCRRPILDSNELEYVFYKGCVGSPLYVAPEVMKGEGYAAESADIFSLGVTLFTLVIGFPPWEVVGSSDPFFRVWELGHHKDFWDFMLKHCTGGPPVDDGFIGLMERMLALNTPRPTCRQLLSMPFVRE